MLSAWVRRSQFEGEQDRRRFCRRLSSAELVDRTQERRLSGDNGDLPGTRCRPREAGSHVPLSHANRCPAEMRLPDLSISTPEAHYSHAAQPGPPELLGGKRVRCCGPL